MSPAALPDHADELLTRTDVERVGEIPPVTVTCDQAIRWLAPVTLSPASLGMPPEVQDGLIRAIAARMRWSAQPLDDGPGMIAGGVVDGIEVQAIAVPGPQVRAVARTGTVTTGEHAGLLRDLVDWSASLPEQVTALEVREDLDESGQLTARLVVAAHADACLIREIVIPVGQDGWSMLAGVGVLPTGHALTVSATR
jgi:hypothetical protein